jgi:hypothetical protein
MKKLLLSMIFILLISGCQKIVDVDEVNSVKEYRSKNWKDFNGYYIYTIKGREIWLTGNNGGYYIKGQKINIIQYWNGDLIIEPIIMEKVK